MPRPNVEWVAQVSLLRPGFLLADPSYRNTQVSKARTWALSPRPLLPISGNHRTPRPGPTQSVDVAIDRNHLG